MLSKYLIYLYCLFPLEDFHNKQNEEYPHMKYEDNQVIVDIPKFYELWSRINH
jgi:hypothetical protein